MWWLDHLDPKLAQHAVTLLLASAIGGMVSVGRFAVATYVDRRLPRRLGWCSQFFVAVGCAILSSAVAFAVCCLVVDNVGSLYSLFCSVGVAIGFDAMSTKAAREFGLFALKAAAKYLEATQPPDNNAPP